jgi:crossover junction endodeoxyribonuclease RuvC
MRLLCLDLATRVGWACGSLENTPPVAYGVVDLPPHTGRERGRYLATFRNWLDAAIKSMAPTGILFESPILTPKTTVATVSKLWCLSGIAELVAWDHELQCEEADLGSIRQHFIGMRKAPVEIRKQDRRGWLKYRIISECRSRGFHVADDNDADALALLSYGLCLKRPGFDLRAAA